MKHDPTLSGIGTCNHIRYAMSCDDLEDLLKRASHRCEICGCFGSSTKHGKLFIDHDPRLGDWAVRGLLCNLCNSNLDRLSHPKAVAYMSSPWHHEMLAKRGLSSTVQPEPSLGTRVYVKGRTWTRGTKGWEPASAHRSMTKSWELLNKKFGPFNIEVPPKA